MTAKQVTNNFKIAAFGEVLWDLLPDTSVLGGAPFNFIYRINSLGNDGVMISAVGDDIPGQKARETIAELNISNRFIQTNQNYPTGIVNVFLDKFSNPDYEIIRNVAYDFISFNEELEGLIPQVDCICFGTLAQRNSLSKDTLKKILKLFKGKYRFYDLNLRKDCYSVENIISSLHNADILKLNKQESNALQQLLSFRKMDHVEFCKELIKSFLLKYCVITLEEFGSLAVSNANEVVYSPGFEVKLVDPLGSGDSYSAAFVDALLRGKSLGEASEAGNLLGAMVAAQKGATQKISADELYQIALKSKRIVDQSLNKKVIFNLS